MTKNRARKQDIRATQAQTGSTYSEARRQHMAGMSELDRLKQTFQQGRIERTTRMIEQCVNVSTLREFHSFLTSDQDALNHPANTEFTGNVNDRIKVLELES